METQEASRAEQGTRGRHGGSASEAAPPPLASLREQALEGTCEEQATRGLAILSGGGLGLGGREWRRIGVTGFLISALTWQML